VLLKFYTSQGIKNQHQLAQKAMIQFISYWTGLSSCSSVQIARSWSKQKKINSLETYLNMKIAISYKSYTKPQRTFTRRTQWARFQFPKRMAT